MSKLTDLKNRFKKVAPSAIGVGSVALAGNASALDLTTSINDAVSGATANIGVAATGLITVAAVMMGIGLIVSALKR